MLYIFIGQSCTGKSTAAQRLKELIAAEVYSGKDYLRLAKSEGEAWKLFYEKLVNAVLSTDKSIIYIITEKEQLAKIEAVQGAVKVKFTASLEVIKSRFKDRMRGNLPQPVEKMLEKQFTEWESITGDRNIDTTENVSIDELIKGL